MDEKPLAIIKCIHKRLNVGTGGDTFFISKSVVIALR